MGRSQGENFPDEFPGYGEHRYGEVGEGIVDAFWTVLDSLSEPLMQDGCNEDAHIRNALWALADMDLLVACLRPDMRVSVEERADLDASLAAARTAMPISEAEARWLHSGDFDFEREVIGIDLADYATRLASVSQHRQGEIVSNGVWIPVRSEELTTRWAAWRRQEGVFAGQGTLDLAREALRRVIQIMEPGRELPDSYLDLRAQ